MDVYAYENLQSETFYRILNGQTLVINTTMPNVMPRIDMSRTVPGMREFNAWYRPGQENCAIVGLNKLEEIYPFVRSQLNTEPEYPTTRIVFQLPWEASVLWGADYQGIYGLCDPWTDNLNARMLREYLIRNIAHELTHQFIDHIAAGPGGYGHKSAWIPYFMNEGKAKRIEKRAIIEQLNCSNIVNIAINFTPGDQAQYESAACAWQISEDQEPGLILRVIAQVSELYARYNMQYENSGYFIISILNKLEIFVNNGFDRTTLNTQNDEMLRKMALCPNCAQGMKCDLDHGNICVHP